MKKYIIEATITEENKPYYKRLVNAVYGYDGITFVDRLILLGGRRFAIATNDAKRAYEYCTIFNGELYLTEHIAETYAIDTDTKFMQGAKL